MLASAHHLKRSTFSYVRHFSYLCSEHIIISRIRSRYAYLLVGKIPNGFFLVIFFFPLQDKLLGIRKKCIYTRARNVYLNFAHFFMGGEEILYRDGPATSVPSSTEKLL